MNSYYEKSGWRDHNNDLMEKVFGAPLPSDYLEFFGDSGMDSFRAMNKRGLLERPTQFVAADTDVELYVKHHFSKVPDQDYPRFIWGDGFAIALKLAEKGGGIYNFDTTKACGEAFWRDRGDTIREIVRLSHMHAGFCFLIFNHALGTVKSSTASQVISLKTHVEHMCKALAPWGARPDRFLSRGMKDADQVQDPAFLGSAGNVEVYKSGNRILRMATIRIYIRNKHVYVEGDFK